LSSVVSAISALTVLQLAPHTPARDVVVCLCLCWSLVADMVDGPLARRLGATSSFGASLDSLADLLAFGVVPAMWCIAEHGVRLGLLVVVPAFAYVVAAAIRLARFVDDSTPPGRFGTTFVGVPTTAAAALILVAVAAGRVAGTAAVDVVALVVAAVLMPSRVPYPKYGIGRWPLLVLVPLAGFTLIGIAVGAAS
jgi:CDP-diacylglycerol--serine O-phosphatidyltransferase